MASMANGVALGIERRRAEAALQESERFLLGTVNALSSHIAILDEQGTILAVNQAWQDFARANAFCSEPRLGIGCNYLAACDGATDACTGSRKVSRTART
jgi:hypothetical protein